MASNATGLFSEMQIAVQRDGSRRRVSDGPLTIDTDEAVGASFVLENPEYNLVTSKSVSLTWCVANVLHFFAATELAGPLYHYNKNATKFLTDGLWRWAYGPIAVPQLRTAVDRLKQDPSTRAAVVYMGATDVRDMNRPCCWSSLQFLRHCGCLDLLVYQRSLNLFGVMPYDCVMLCNVLMYVAERAALPLGVLRWFVGSLHYPVGSQAGEPARDGSVGIKLPAQLLSDPTSCWNALEHPHAWDHPYSEWLKGEEVRS